MARREASDARSSWARRSARALLRLALPSIAALGAYGCMDMHDHVWYRGAPAHMACRDRSSCDACTKAIGCGWCSYADGSGTCTNEPNDCPGEQFEWTWEPVGCQSAADAGADGAGGESGLPDAAGDARTPPDARPD